MKIYAPEQSYRPGDTYILYVTNGVKDRSGNPLKHLTTMEFTIKEDDSSPDKVITLNGVKERNLMAIVTDKQFLMHHTGYIIDDGEKRLLEKDETNMYYYVDTSETSILNKSVRLSPNRLLPKPIRNISYGFYVPENEDYLHRSISLVYLDKFLNSVVYQEEYRKLTKANIQIPSSVIEIKTPAINNYIFD
ncbi:Ig-like domain-containing protein [Sporosarcina sp. FSL K6-5500]|uniref:Ig-like domain-containing protein n=1 Tax=Sporosarcina sp. FSL K6-5500 TaxID=2921558 RepID=UPI0030F99A3F